jgi:hypothetical protein
MSSNSNNNDNNNSSSRSSSNDIGSSRKPPTPPPRPSVAKVTSAPPIPEAAPALPERNKSVDQLMTNSKPVHKIPRVNSDIEEYYAHLGKHVKEVRRRKAKNISVPSLSDFRVKKDEKVISTKWVEFIQAVSLYYYRFIY